MSDEKDKKDIFDYFNGTITTSSGTNGNTISISDGSFPVYIDSTYYPMYGIGDCSVCNKENVMIRNKYNWQDNPETDRKICRKCYTKAMDRMFGVSENRMKTEEVLYGDKNE